MFFARVEGVEANHVGVEGNILSVRLESVPAIQVGISATGSNEGVD